MSLSQKSEDLQRNDNVRNANHPHDTGRYYFKNVGTKSHSQNTVPVAVGKGAVQGMLRIHTSPINVAM